MTEKSNLAVLRTKKITPQQACASAMEHAHEYDKVLIIPIDKDGHIDLIYSEMNDADVAYMGALLQKIALDSSY